MHTSSGLNDINQRGARVDCWVRPVFQSYGREQQQLERSVIDLRAALLREKALVRDREETIHCQQVLSKESAHRFLNGLQMIAGLLRLQSESAADAGAAAQLTAAANRVAMIGRVHERLHFLDGVRSVAFKAYLEDLCRDYSRMLSSEVHEVPIVVEGTDVRLPSDKAIPLGFIVHELITNAARHGKGRIVVGLRAHPAGGYALSVGNDGSMLPEGFDPNLSKGFGMTLICAFVQQLGGELLIDGGESGQGTRFTVLFS